MSSEEIIMGALGLLVIALTVSGIMWARDGIVDALHEIRDELRKGKQP